MLVIVSSFFWSSTWWWLVVLLRDTGWRQWLDSRVNPDRIKPKRDHQNQNDMPWPFCWHGDLQRLGGSSKVTAWITKWPTCPIFFSKVFLGEGFWKQDLVKHPEKKRQKKWIRKKNPTKWIPKNLFCWILAELCGLASKRPRSQRCQMPNFGVFLPKKTDGRWLCQLQRLWGCEWSHSGCFHCSWVIFFRKKTLEVRRQYWAKALEGLIETENYKWTELIHIRISPQQYTKDIFQDKSMIKHI